MISKRGQISGFLIVGVLIVIVFSSLYALNEYFAQQKINQESQRIVNELSNLDSFSFYVNACLKEGIKEGVHLLGQQGGVIYTHQGGLSDGDISFSLDKRFSGFNETYNVSYAITQPIFTELNTPPLWPYSGYIINPLTGQLTKSYFSYGERTFLNLCDVYGENKVMASSNFAFSCPSYMINSSQKQLELFIQNYFFDCVNLTNYSDYFGYTITAKYPVASTLFTPKEIRVYVSFPIEINSSDKHSATQLLDFEQTLDVDILSIYTLAKQIVDREVYDLFFSAQNDVSDLAAYSTRFIVELFCPYCTNQTGLRNNSQAHTDILRIYDTQSFLKGRPYEFQFALENRHPLLDQIRSENIPEYEQFDLIVIEGDEINISPIIFDLEDDNLTVIYSGWKETYDEYFDESCCELNINECRADPFICMRQYPSFVHGNNWSRSTPYLASHINASYVTQINDRGAHVIRVLVQDEEGLSDWQDVTILVDDVPRAVANGYHFYPTMISVYTDPISGNRYHLASLEDFFALSGDDSTDYFSTDIEDYSWSVRLLTAVSGVSFEDKSFAIPNPLTAITDMKNRLVSEVFTSGNAVYNATLTVRNPNYGTYTQDSILINVSQCFDHVSAAPPYPYNNMSFLVDGVRVLNFISSYDSTSGDPFLADHACCTAANSYETVGTPCFEYVSYGRPAVFDLTLFEGFPDVAINRPVRPTTFASENDVYRREFTQLCSGDRGNICSGTVTDTLSIESQCSDTLTSGQDERCSGPYQNVINYETPQQNSCQLYTGTTFEQVAGYAGADGLCNNGFMCSDSSNNFNGAYGRTTGGDRYVCQSTCDGVGGCTRTRNCFDCYSVALSDRGLSCSDTDFLVANQGVNFEQAGTVSTYHFDTCTNPVPLVESNPQLYCQQQTVPSTYTDTCASDGYTLTEYSCVQINPTLNPNVGGSYQVTQTDCRNGEISALGYEDRCESFGVRSCSSGQCVESSAATELNMQFIVGIGHPSLVQGTNAYRRFSPVDTNGNGVFDSCQSQDLSCLSMAHTQHSCNSCFGMGAWSDDDLDTVFTCNTSFVPGP